MKKLLTLAMALMLATTLSFAQTGSGTTKGDTGKKETKTSKAHKGGKKGKKSTTNTGTDAPK